MLQMIRYDKPSCNHISQLPEKNKTICSVIFHFTTRRRFYKEFYADYGIDNESVKQL